MSAKQVTAAEQRETETRQAALDVSEDALQVAQQSYDRAFFKLRKHQQRLAVKYRLRGKDEITAIGDIVREK